MKRANETALVCKTTWLIHSTNKSKEAGARLHSEFTYHRKKCSQIREQVVPKPPRQTAHDWSSTCLAIILTKARSTLSPDFFGLSRADIDYTLTWFWALFLCVSQMSSLPEPDKADLCKFFFSFSKFCSKKEQLTLKNSPLNLEETPQTGFTMMDFPGLSTNMWKALGQLANTPISPQCALYVHTVIDCTALCPSCHWRSVV